MEALLYGGSDVLATDSDGKTAQNLAKENKHKSISKLIKGNAELDSCRAVFYPDE